MGQLREDIAEIRRARRDVRAGLYAKWDAEGVRRPHWWSKLLTWSGAILGIYLLLAGDTVERVFGAVLVAAPALIAATTAWVYWKALRMVRRARG